MCLNLYEKPILLRQPSKQWFATTSKLQGKPVVETEKKIYDIIYWVDKPHFSIFSYVNSSIALWLHHCKHITGTAPLTATGE